MTIGEKIVFYRNNACFSQEELAYRVGTNVETLIAWEENKEIPNSVHLLMLKRALSVSIDEILSPNAPKRKMSGGQKALSLTLFILSIASIFFALIVMAILSSFVNVNDAYKNMWVFFVFAPIPIGSVIFGFICKKKGISAKKNIITGFIMLPFLIIYGCFCFIPFNTSLNPDKGNSFLQSVSAQTGINLPRENESIEYHEYKNGYSSMKSTIYAECIVSFDRENTEKLLSEINSTSKWKKLLPNYLIGYLPETSRIHNYGNYYYLIYNTHTKEYNVTSKQDGRVPFIALIYDCNNNYLYVYDYVIDCIK